MANKSKLNAGVFSSVKDNWGTPPEFFDKLDSEYHFTLDPAAEPSNAKCSKFYTKEDDGLSKSWQGEIVFVNPPYGNQTKAWIEKARSEWEKGDCTIILLLASRTDNRWFHSFIYAVDGAKWWFTKGRIKFVDPDTGKKAGSPAFGSLIVIFEKGKIYRNVFEEV